MGAPGKLENLNSVKQTNKTALCWLNMTTPSDWLGPGISTWGLEEMLPWHREGAEIWPL